MWERIRNNPAIMFSLVEAVVALAVAFGLQLTGEQVGAIMAVVAILTGVGVRASVYGPRTVDTIMDADTVITAAEGTPEL